MEEKKPEWIKKHIEVTAALSERYAPVQRWMEAEARSTFSQPQLDSLRVLVRITFEFSRYLEFPKISDLKDYLPKEPSLRKFYLEQPHLFDDFELKYAINTILNAVEFFLRVDHAYSALANSIESSVDWDEISRANLEKNFIVKFSEFQAESVFERKCRILLDLFRLQLVFAAFYSD